MECHGHQSILGLERAVQKLHLNTQPYQYSPLNEEAQEIRLLTLLPGRFSSEVRVCLETTPFTEEVIPQFEALSYAWGSEENPVNIFIGPSGFHTLAVTQNLAEALPYLRYKDRPRVLWIDAICVNQKDLEERSRQVKRMADIFSKAARVVIWLGPESDDSPVATECIDTISSHVKVDWGRLVLLPAAVEEHWADRSKELPFKETQLLAIIHLIHRPWFERLWIWQEVQLATEDVVVICGTQLFKWNILRTAVACLCMKTLAKTIHNIAYRKNRLYLVFSLCQGLGTQRLGDLIEMTTNALCSDPRDRIFALLSLLSDFEKGIGIEPDYTKSAHKIYEDTVCRYVRHTETLEILSSIEVHQDVEDLPSWVPDWSVQRTTMPLRLCFASGLSAARAEFREGGIMQVVGVSVGVVEQAVAFNLSEFASYNEWYQKLIEVLSTMRLNSDQICKKGMKQRSLCRVLSSNRFADSYSPPETRFLSRQQSEEALHSLLQNQANTKRILTLEERKFLNRVGQRCANRSLFLTEDKQIGLGPNPTTVGDIVTVLLGCGPCMILRPVRNGQFQVVGSAFCDGFMEGQALMGPLPDNFDLVWRYIEKSKANSCSYYNRETGTFQPEHPGLGQLPLGWSKKSHPNEEFWTIFENEETGEETDFDPRLLPEHLKKRGVDVRTFDLV